VEPRDLSDVWVLVPVFNEAPALGGVLHDLLQVFPNVVCVDDGSSDGSDLVARSHGVAVLRHAINLGQGAALRTGLEFARSEPGASYIVTFDADGQHSVADALAMVQVAMAEEVDIVLGSRTQGSAVDQPRAKALLLQAGLRYARWSSGLDLTDTHNGLRVLNRRAFEAIELRQRRMAHASELERLIASNKLTWREHPISVTYSEYSMSKGQSNLNAFNVLFDLFAARLDSPS
jgi:glycosyltransferase involved in cell wall biosynthesis